MDKLKELRHALGFTQEEMADFLNVSLSLYQKMEIGNKNFYSFIVVSHEAPLSFFSIIKL